MSISNCWPLDPIGGSGPFTTSGSSISFSVPAGVTIERAENGYIIRIYSKTFVARSLTAMTRILNAHFTSTK